MANFRATTQPNGISQDRSRSFAKEAFRCKDITAKLLSLARQGDESRQDVCLADVADKVVSIIGGLRENIATAG